MASIPSSAHFSSDLPSGAPATPTAPTIDPEAWIVTPPPKINIPGSCLIPDASILEFTTSESEVVAERKLMDVFTFNIAPSGDETPASLSLSTTCKLPPPSTTATETWNQDARQLSSAFLATISAASGVNVLEVKRTSISLSSA